MAHNWTFAQPSADLEAAVHSFLSNWEHDQPFYIKSSGTTSLPQTFQFSKAQLIFAAQASITALDLQPQTRALLCLPTTSVGGLMLMARSKVGNFSLLLQTPSSRPLAQNSAALDFIAMVPTQLQQSLLHDLSQLKQVAKILVGGGTISNELKQACQKEGLQVWQSYGMTETLSHVALKKISPCEDPYFKALPGVEFSSLDACLVISYPGLLTAPLLTKDLIDLHSPSTFTWLGRADHAINSGGFKIIPELLEAKLAAHIESAFFLCAIADEKWGQIVGMVIEANSLPQLPDFSKLDLSKAETPKKVALLPHFERTETQKIKRSKCIQLLKDVDWITL
ncbi:MAG: AMP-binding protein [Flavobacteriales bacterium]